MATTSRGADLLVKTLAAVGTRYVFALSGNQINSWNHNHG